MVDEAATSGEANGDASGRRRAATRHKSEHYGEAEFLDNARRVVDLVPRGLVAWVFVVLGGVTLIVGLEALYASLPDWCAAGQTIPALDLAAEGSLAAWFSSLLLLGAALAALIVYAVRRHRTDDYRGRYRLWLAAAACWLLLATDEAASLHESLQELLANTSFMSHSTFDIRHSVWWLLAYALFGGAVAVRAALDMRESRLALTVFILAVVGFAVDAMFRLNVVVCPTETARIMAIEGAEMAAYLLLFAAMGLYARHVLLDAEGLLTRKAKAKKAKSAAKKDAAQPADEPQAAPAEKQSADTRIDPPHAVSAPKSAAVVTAAAPQTATSEETTDADRKLSKADRKAMKDKMLRDRLKREQERQGKWK